MNVTKNLGMLFLAIYLLIVGISALVPISGLGLIGSVCALVAGIFILFGK